MQLFVNSFTSTFFFENKNKKVAQLSTKYNFPICFPEDLPAVRNGFNWSITIELNKDKFIATINQIPTGELVSHCTSMYYGTLTGGSISPQIFPEEANMVEYQCEIIDITEDVSAMVYSNNPRCAGTTTVTWDSNNWAYFVTANPGTGENSAISIAKQIAEQVENEFFISNYVGKFRYICTSNAGYSNVTWQISDDTWYELVWKGSPLQAISILCSMSNTV